MTFCTPLTGIPDPPHVADLMAGILNKNLSRRLEKVVKSREVTPEPQSLQNVEECHQWRCEELRNHFKPHEADKHRMRISKRGYWETEYLYYNEAFKKLMLQKSCAVHNMDNWRALALFYRDLLKHSGLNQAINNSHQIIASRAGQGPGQGYPQA